jgi:NADH/NAD ratio-sensing transcriptional regulator Rex
MSKTLNSCLYELILLSLDNNVSINEILNKQEVYSVAIYGLGMLGDAIYRFLIANDVNIIFGMDQDKNKKKKGLTFKDYKTESLPPVDMVVVTPIEYIDEIKSDLKFYTDAKIVSVCDFLDELLVARVL